MKLRDVMLIFTAMIASKIGMDLYIQYKGQENECRDTYIQIPGSCPRTDQRMAGMMSRGLWFGRSEELALCQCQPSKEEEAQEEAKEDLEECPVDAGNSN